MAIDARIPLGVQPVQTQQPNMLAQYAQVMAIKAAQQEMRGGQEMRDLFAGGANFDDPEFQRRGYAANPGKFQDLLGKRATTRKTELEAIANDIKLRRDAIGKANTNEDYLNWHDANHTGRTGAYFKSIGVSPSRESIIAQLNQPGGLAKLKQASAIGSTKLEEILMNEARAIKVANIGAGPGNRNADINQKRFDLDQADSAAISNILGGSPTAPAAAVTPPIMGGGGGGGGAPITSVSPAPMAGSPAPVAGPVTQPNVLATQVAPPAAPSVNALDPNAQTSNTIDQISALIRTGKPKAIQAAEALIKDYNIRNPEGAIQQDASGALVTVNKRTNVAKPVLDKDGKPVMGDSKYESAYHKEVGGAKAKSDIALVQNAENSVDKLKDINATLAQLQSSDAITGFGANVLKDVERIKAQFTTDKKAGKRVADTEILNAMLGSEVFGMIQSLGIGARGLDTPAEREYLREVMTGTVTMNKAALIRLTEIRKNVTERAIDKYNEKVERGDLNKFFETQGIAPRRIEKTSAASTGDISVDPAIQSLLNKYK